MATIVDPRRRQQLGLPPLSYGAGTLNNAAPSFQGSNYYNQMFNRPIQDWSQFMPTNSPLAGGGGINYQNPWGYGSGGGSGWGGTFGGFPGGGFMGGGGGYGGGYPGWGGGYPGWSGTTAGPSYIPPRLGGGDTGGFPPWMNPGNPWATPTDGSLPGPRPGSDKASDVAVGRIHHPEMYDADDMWVGAEGTETIDATDPLGIGPGILGWMGADTAEDQRLGTYSSANYDESMLRSFDPSRTTPGTDFFGGDVTAPTTAMGLLGRQVFDDDPVAFATGTGLLGPDEGTINQPTTVSVPTAFDDFSAANPYAAGPPGASFNDFSAANPYAGWGPNEFTGANTSPYSGGGDPLANTGGLRHSNVNANVWSAPSMTPTTPAYSTQGDVPTRNVIPNVNVPNTGPPGLAAAQERAYLQSLNDEDARRMMNMSQAQVQREVAGREAARDAQIASISGTAMQSYDQGALSRALAEAQGGGGGGGGGGNGGRGGWGGGRE